MKTRLEQDALQRTSGDRLEQAREVKKECERTRKALPKYLQGHLFQFQVRRIERHLNVCAHCTSELHSLRLAADTQQLLKDITPSEGLAARLETALMLYGRIRILLYRPLWIILMVLIAAYLYLFVIVPFRHDPELESIERSLPVGEVSTLATSQPTPSPALVAVPTLTPASNLAANAAAPVPSVEPLVMTIIPDDHTSVRRINDVLKGHAVLGKMRFTDVVREVSGSLPPGELQALVNRIEPAGRVSYSRKRFSALSGGELIPFVMKLKDAPPIVSSPTATAHL